MRGSESVRVLVVDDEDDIRKLVAFNLEKAGFVVKAVANGREALAQARSWSPAVIVLDLMLPDISGPEVCRTLREDPSCAALGILMLTARGDEYDRVHGFEVGTDDYVVKPFSPRELIHRVRALARRAMPAAKAPPSTSASDVLRWKDVVLDLRTHETRINGRSVELRPLEFRLLQAFLEQPACVLTRSQLLASVWGVTAQINTRTVDTHVRRLREALGESANLIETVHGFGYRLCE